MSQFLASSSMAPSSHFQVIFEKALEVYQQTTKQDLTTHPLASQLQACDSPAAILTILQEQVNQSVQSRSGDERLTNWLDPTINVLYAFSATLGEGVGLAFPPAKAIFAGVGVLLSVMAKDAGASREVLIGVFDRVESFFRRLEVYVDVPPTPAMTDMMVKIMVEVLYILGTATKEVKQSRSKKFLKKMMGKRTRRLEDSLKELDKMMTEGALMANAEVLKFTYNIDNKVRVKEKMQVVIDDIDDVKGMQLLMRFRKWQSPPDPSTNQNTACRSQHEGTAEWFFKGSVFRKWKAAGSLMWIHGKPGSGKSVLCSAIIQDIATLRDAGLASMAYFYFDLRDMSKRSRRGLLTSLLVQLSAHSNPFCDLLSLLYDAHNDGARRPSDSALSNCLKEMLTLPDRAPVYLILDALDECPNTSGVPSSREQVLDLLKELVGLHLPSLHICVTSRRELDIRDTLESLMHHSVSLHDESGQKADIAEYVRSVVYSDTSTIMRRWRDADKNMVIKTLSERADGMFRWVFCQLETLRHCLPQNIPRILKELPASLDETYERALKEIGTANQHHAYRLLQCLAVAIRPLRVEELTEILALDFEGANIGKLELKKDWRRKDQQEAVLSTCSSLIAVVNDGSHRVVQFSHFLVKEFLTSSRLASSSADISHFHILLTPAHTVIAKACLEILLQSDNGMGDAAAKNNSSLAKYAAEHWVDHARFEEVSTHLQGRMQLLFDPAMPYFETWLKLYDIDQGWDEFMDYDKQRGSPLYYASLCGFQDLAAHLIAKHPQHVNATLGRCFSPLVAALYKRHFGIAELLYRHGADVGIRGYENRTLLHAASVEGFVDIAQWLLDRCVDAQSQQDNHETLPHLAEANGSLGNCKNVDAVDNANRTPLHLASLYGHIEIMRVLIKPGADVNARDRNNNTPLHLASSSGSPESVQLLIKNGADINARDRSNNTPLHLASTSGRPEAVQLLIEHGVDVNARDGNNKTPLHLASTLRSPETVRVLIKHGVGVNARDGNDNTPLHLASSSGSPESVQLLIKHGADINARDRNSNAPLHLASSSRRPETVQLLIGHGVDIDARDGKGKTPLHLASYSGSPESVRLLIEHGAEVNSGDRNDNTPLHLALSSQNPEVVRLLMEHGAQVTSQDRWNWTPLHLVSSTGSHETVQLLIELGVDVNARDGNDNTPLHLASSSGSLDTVQLLIGHGADVNARDGNYKTPLHLASFLWSPGIVRVLIGKGANVDTRDQNRKTPLHLASSSRCPETVRVLIEHGANVNSRDENHKTPLHLVSSSRSPEIVRLLIEHGAVVNAKDESLKTPLHLASSSWRPEIAQLLLKHGADVNARDGSHRTPLHLASSQEETFPKPTAVQRAKSDKKADIVQVLIKHGADVTAQDDTRLTPLHLASSKGSGKTVEFLLSHGADVNAQDMRHSTPLHLAASSHLALEGNVVRLLLSHGANVYARDVDGRTSFQIASSEGLSEIAELLSPK